MFLEAMLGEDEASFLGAMLGQGEGKDQVGLGLGPVRMVQGDCKGGDEGTTTKRTYRLMTELVPPF
jgi:hypothetical protein